MAWRDEPPTSYARGTRSPSKPKRNPRPSRRPRQTTTCASWATTRCAPRRSACASLTSFDQSLKRANARGRPSRRPSATQPCHLDYGAEDARVFSCALATPENILRERLAYVKRNVHSLYFAVGLARAPRRVHGALAGGR